MLRSQRDDEKNNGVREPLASYFVTYIPHSARTTMKKGKP